jgi:hypothetical protein
MRFTTVLYFLLLSAGVSAQKPDAGDSVYFYQQTAAQLQFMQRNATQLINTAISKAGTIAIELQTTRGHFRHAQEAEYATIATMQTEGFSTTNRFKTSGYFSFSRTWEDSLAWTQKSNNTGEQPYYLASAKAGPYLRQRYNMGGIVSYNLVKDKLYIATGLDYNYGEDSRSIDPRLSATTFSLLLKPELSYRWKNTTMGMGLRWGYGKEKNNINYKNENYKNGIETYPERVNYLVQGFGNITYGGNNLIRKANYSGLFLNYTVNPANWLLRGEAGYTVHEEDNAQVRPTKDSLLATFQLSSSHLSLLLQHTGGLVHKQLSAEILVQNGRDYNVKAGASTYTYQHTSIALQYLCLFTSPKKSRPEIGITARYDDTYKKDGVSSHMINYKWIQPGIKGTIYTNLANKDRFSFTLSPSIRLPMLSELKIAPTQESYFTKGVVYPDYIYQTTRALETDIVIRYITQRLFKTFPAGITARLTYTKPLATPETTLPASLVPGKDRLYANCSFNLYF